MIRFTLLIALTLCTQFIAAQNLADAIQQTKNEQFETAEATFNQLLKVAPKNGEYYYYFGENFYKNDNFQKAEEMYAKGIEENATNPYCHIGIGKVLWKNNKQEEAKKEFYSAISLIPKKDKITEAKVKMAIAANYIHAETTNLDEASRLLNNVLAIQPQLVELYILRGDLFLKQNYGNASKAITQYEKAEQMDKTAVTAILRQGKIYNNGKNYDLAIEYYDKAIAVNPTFAPAYREKAEIYFRAGQYTNATNEFKKYLELNNNCSAQGRYAGFLNQAKKYQESINAATKALTCDSTNAYTYRYKARSEYEAGDYKNGLISITRFFDLAQNSSTKVIADDHIYFSKFYSQNENKAAAAKELIKASKINPTDLKKNREIAKLLMKIKNYDAAKSVYNNNIKTGKENANDYFGLGRAHYYSQEFTSADSAFSEITKSNPQLPLGYIWRARANSQQDPNNEQWLAKPHYEAFISKITDANKAKNKKSIIEAYTYLGVNAMKMKEMCTAKEYFLKIKALDPTNANASKFLKSPEAQKCP